MNAPTPWIRDKHDHICTRVDKDGYAAVASSVCLTDFSLSGGEEAKANTALILRAVNSHDALVSALENCMAQIQQYDPAGCNAAMPYDRLAQARAALKLAKGEA